MLLDHLAFLAYIISLCMVSSAIGDIVEKKYEGFSLLATLSALALFVAIVKGHAGLALFFVALLYQAVKGLVAWAREDAARKCSPREKRRE